MQKARPWLISLGLIFILALGAAGCGAGQRTPTPQASPTPSPSPTSSYRNETYGFSLSFPTDWVESETGQQQPVVEIRGPGGLPIVGIAILPLSQRIALADLADQALEELKAGLTNFQEASRGEVALGQAVGQEVVFTGFSGSNELKVKVIFLLQGSQALEVLAFSTRANYDRLSDTIDSVVYSLRLEEARPFGISRGQALTLLDAGPVSLDPALAREVRSASYIVEIFSGLVALDQDLEVVPEIARNWEVSGDGRVYTFHLRPGVKFHSGREVTAADFKYSIERAADPKTGSQTAATYLGDIVGVKEKLAGQVDQVEGVQVIDARTLEITIDAPKVYFLKKLTHIPAMVVDRENVEQGEEWWRRPNGTGPFKLKEWKEDELLILERNPDYYLGVPQLPFAVFRLFAGIPMLMYESGEIDISGVSSDDLERVQDPANPLNKELVSGPSFSLFYIGFNHTRPPFDDPLVRQAFSYATDKDKLADLVFLGAVRRADSILPPGMPGYSPQVKALGFDLNKAKELLAQSRYGGDSRLPELVFTSSSFGSDPGPLVSALVDMWQQNLGVTFQNVRIIDPNQYAYVIREEKDDMFDLGWVADYPDPENFLDVLFHSQSSENVGEYSNSEVDGLLERARGEMDQARRMELYHRAEQQILDDAAVLPMFFGMEYQLVKPYVKGYRLTPIPIPILKYVSLEGPR